MANELRTGTPLFFQQNSFYPKPQYYVDHFDATARAVIEQVGAMQESHSQAHTAPVEANARAIAEAKSFAALFRAAEKEKQRRDLNTQIEFVKQTMQNIKIQIAQLTNLLSELTAGVAKEADLCDFRVKKKSLIALHKIPNDIPINLRDQQRERIFKEAAQAIREIVNNIDSQQIARDQERGWEEVGQDLDFQHFRLGQELTLLKELETTLAKI